MVTPELSALLKEVGLDPEEQNEIAKQGATEISDIRLLREDDLEMYRLNIRLVPWRKLLQAAQAAG